MDGTYTFNKGNWSGETASIVVKDNKFKYMDNEFELVEKFHQYEGCGRDYVVAVKGYSEPLYRLNQERNGMYWARSADIEREHKNPFILAAIMASNLM